MRIRQTVLFLSLAAALTAGGVSCDLRDAVTCDPDELDLERGTVGNFGPETDQAAQKIEAFFESTIALQDAAEEMANSLVAACTNVGNAVGVPASEMQPTQADPTDADRIHAACDRVATEIRAIIAAAVPRGAFLSVEMTPPACNVEVNAYANCVGGCDVDVNPATLTVDCEPGTIAIGQCSGSCSGECWVRASAACAGECSAQCTGTCAGTCYGGCTGTCSEIDGSGNCVGTCTGTCTGTCAGTCTGNCSGSCRADVTGACGGECHGSCDVWVSPPRCEVFARPGSVDVDCHASCEASLRAEASCTEGEVAVNYGILGGDTAAQTRLRTLATALRANLPVVAAATVRAGEAVRNMIGAFFQALDGIADSFTAAVDAFACALVALQVEARVSLTFTASFEASAGVTAAVSAEGSATVP